MKKKVKIVTHGSTWIDTSAPIVCPECASLNVKEYTYNDSEWHGPFLVGYSEKICSCEDCNCRFKISKDKKYIDDCCWDELSAAVAIISGIIFLILVIIWANLWNNDKQLPLPMIIAIITDAIIGFISFLVWLVTA